MRFWILGMVLMGFVGCASTGELKLLQSQVQDSNTKQAVINETNSKNFNVVAAFFGKTEEKINATDKVIAEQDARLKLIEEAPALAPRISALESKPDLTPRVEELEKRNPKPVYEIFTPYETSDLVHKITANQQPSAEEVKDGVTPESGVSPCQGESCGEVRNSANVEEAQADSSSDSKR